MARLLSVHYSIVIIDKSVAHFIILFSNLLQQCAQYYYLLTDLLLKIIDRCHSLLKYYNVFSYHKSVVKCTLKVYKVRNAEATSYNANIMLM